MFPAAAVDRVLQNDLSRPHQLPPLTARPGHPPRSRPVRHPRGLYVLSLAEAGERFGFYLMVALFTLYLNERHGFSQERAGVWYGNYLAACYAVPFLGGWLAGRFVARRVWVQGAALILAAGYYLLALERLELLPVALVVLGIGNGFFKPNISTQVGELYSPGDARRDEAFGLFYLAINVGALCGPFVGELLRGRFGFGAAFGAAAVALIGSALVLSLGRCYLPTGQPKELLEKGLAPVRHRVAALLLIGALLVPFWMGYQQFGSSLTFYARDGVDRGIMIGGVHRDIPPGWFAASNAFFVLALTAPLAWLVRRLTSADKIVGGLAISAMAFGGLSLAAYLCGPAKLSPSVLIGYYLVITMSELLLSPVGLSLVSKLSPPRWVGVLFGVWFVSTALGNWLAGQIGKLWAAWSHAHFFGLLGALLLGSALLLATQLGWLRRTMPRNEV